MDNNQIESDIDRSELDKFKEFVENSDMLDSNKQIILATINNYLESNQS